MSSTPPRDVAATLRVMDVLKSRPGVRTLSSLVLAGFRMFGVTALWGPEAMVPGAILTVTGMTLLGYLALRHWWIARLELIQGAGRMKAGVFDRPVKVPRGNEYTELAEVLNQVSESVERRLETLEHERHRGQPARSAAEPTASRGRSSGVHGEQSTHPVPARSSAREASRACRAGGQGRLTSPAIAGGRSCLSRRRTHGAAGACAGQSGSRHPASASRSPSAHAPDAGRP